MRAGRASLGLLALVVLLAAAATVLARPRRGRAPDGAAAALAARDTIDVRVLVLNFDPPIPDSGGRPAHAAFGWRDPRALARDFAADVQRASGGAVRYRTTRWVDVPAFPAKGDGFRYTAASYAACVADHARCHDPDGVDYSALLRAHGVTAQVDAGAVDELWLFGGPWFGYWEAAMAGPGAFDVNGGPIPGVAARRPFVVMGFNYERGVAEMLEDLCHRTEATLARAYGGWEAGRLDTPWARFAANAWQARGVAGVGSCHVPPNGEREYDYDNARLVQSDADDWLGYPALTGARRPVSRASWGGPDYHRNYLRWWFRHLPHAAGATADGRPANWWRYVYRFDSLLVAR